MGIRVFSFYLFFPFISSASLAQSAGDPMLPRGHFQEFYVRYTQEGTPDSGNVGLKAALLNYENRGFILYERRHKYDRALKIMDDVVPIWQLIGDTSNLANVLKFRGLMKAHLGEFEMGKNDLFESIRLFQLKGFIQGVNVAKYDLATLYVLQDSLGIAKIMADSIKQFWTAKGDKNRVFINNNLLIRILTLKSDFKEARKVQFENKSAPQRCNRGARPDTFKAHIDDGYQCA